MALDRDKSAGLVGSPRTRLEDSTWAILSTGDSRFGMWTASGSSSPPGLLLTMSQLITTTSYMSKPTRRTEFFAGRHSRTVEPRPALPQKEVKTSARITALEINGCSVLPHPGDRPGTKKARLRDDRERVLTCCQRCHR